MRCSRHSLLWPRARSILGPVRNLLIVRFMDLATFAHGLAACIGRPSTLRPFVCDGSPLNCRVFIVGYNPATTSGQDFWRHWGPSGFDRAAWMKDYLVGRATAPLNPGKKFRPKVSPSRRVIDWILEAAGVPILETNLYAQPSLDMASLADHDMAPFQFLVRTIKPRLMVTHGKNAREGVAALGLSVPVIEVPHFSRGWSRAAAHDLGRQIKREAGLDVP